MLRCLMLPSRCAYCAVLLMWLAARHAGCLPPRLTNDIMSLQR